MYLNFVASDPCFSHHAGSLYDRVEMQSEKCSYQLISRSWLLLCHKVSGTNEYV